MDFAQGAASAAAGWRPWSVCSRARVVFLWGEQQAAGRIARQLLGQPLQRKEYAGLIGAPDQARVEVGASDGALYFELRDPLGAAYRGYYYLRRQGAVVTLMNDGFRIDALAMRRQGIGLQIFYRQSRNAAALGLGRIETVAGRRRDENGYYTWPRYGFDGALPASVRRSLPAGLDRSCTVLDLMSCKRGRHWWAEHGVTLRVRFDLTPGSRSRRTLARYVRGRT